MKLSVIVPLAPGETAWRGLLPDLAALPEDAEILLVGPEDPGDVAPARWLRAGGGRGAQMNAGAAAAGGAVLWFLHADSRLGAEAVPALLAALGDAPGALHYFDLQFLPDATPLMALNALGVRFRCRVLKTPFGDQGLAIAADSFAALDGYATDGAPGEDHDFVWRARRAGLEVRPVGAVIRSSARKYAARGWLATTWLHQRLWLKQAWPHWRAPRRGQ